MKAPFTFRLYQSIKFNRPINTDMDNISPGGYEICVMDENGKEHTVKFDFEDYEGRVDDSDPTILHCVQKNPDYNCFEDLSSLNEHMIKNIKKVEEWFIYTGEPCDLEDNVTPLIPDEIQNAYFELISETGHFDNVPITVNIMPQCAFSDEVNEPTIMREKVMTKRPILPLVCIAVEELKAVIETAERYGIKLMPECGIGAGIWKAKKELEIIVHNLAIDKPFMTEAGIQDQRKKGVIVLERLMSVLVLLTDTEDEFDRIGATLEPEAFEGHYFIAEDACFESILMICGTSLAEAYRKLGYVRSDTVNGIKTWFYSKFSNAITSCFDEKSET